MFVSLDLQTLLWLSWGLFLIDVDVIVLNVLHEERTHTLNHRRCFLSTDSHH